MNLIPQPKNPDGCVACRRWLLMAEPGPRAVSGQTEAVLAHLQSCPACRAYADEIQVWRQLGRRLRQPVVAPSEVRQRIFRELALARTQWLRGDKKTHRRWPWMAALAAAILLLAVSGLWQLPRGSAPSSSDVASAVGEDHWRELHHEHIDSTDPAAVQRWLSARLPIPAQVMALQGGALQGARLCFLRGRLGAVLRYRVGASSVSYYVMPADTRGDDVNRERTALQKEVAQGYNVVLWHERGLLHALVGDLPRSHLVKLASSCHPAKLTPPV